jgi:hypothetical protein
VGNLVKVIRLSHHRKLRGAPLGNISDWLRNTDVLRVTTPVILASDYINVLWPEESFTFIPPTTIFCLLRLPSASYDYLLPLITTCSLLRLPAPS